MRFSKKPNKDLFSNIKLSDVGAKLFMAHYLREIRTYQRYMDSLEQSFVPEDREIYRRRIRDYLRSFQKERASVSQRGQFKELQALDLEHERLQRRYLDFFSG